MCIKKYIKHRYEKMYGDSILVNNIDSTCSCPAKFQISNSTLTWQLNMAILGLFPEFRTTITVKPFFSRITKLFPNRIGFGLTSFSEGIANLLPFIRIDLNKYSWGGIGY